MLIKREETALSRMKEKGEGKKRVRDNDMYERDWKGKRGGKRDRERDRGN